ncbi:unnamed protein product [Paramecium primaurelia]|uniref:Uncharacterized protein n=2 Tax=Paramecium TaxID=5884 RepID=A0A8S1VSW1_9CILI|nr:unnamed protein product [Paramecium primaurelia]CAD8179851.1 unnamed protein product [Paramecium pentaurelia]
MDKLLQREIRNHFQNENYKADVIDMIEKDEELIKKCNDKMDDWQLQTEEDFLKKKLLMLGLCEKKGLDGQVMLYPTIKKQRVLNRDEFKGMVDRLYKVKKMSDNDFVHLNQTARKQIQQMKAKQQMIQKQKNKNTKQESFFDMISDSSEDQVE